tara:strand:- start:144 stop:554 length:411 start_codon:yes stop_codon:yes gene_type:complete
MDLFETEHWKVILLENQAYLGRAILLHKQAAKNLSELNDKEWQTLHQVIKQLESAIKKAFKAEPFNWTCLMNDAYKENPPKPYVHLHLFPRYRDSVKVKEETFTDPNFAHHYDKAAENIVSEETLKNIAEEIKKHL